MKRKITKVETTETTDKETGDITLDKMKATTYAIEREPNYVKIYLEDISRLKDIPPGMNKVLFELMNTLRYNGIIMAYAPVKKLMCLRLGISMSYLNKSINEFYKKGILIRYARGVYIADPNLFAKGSWSNISKLRLVIDYHEDGTKSLKSGIPEEVESQLKLEI